MAQLYMIPDKNRIEESLELAHEYHASFEYNDFFKPAVLEDDEKIKELISFYVNQSHNCSEDTMHGAFLDITIHSTDPLIRRVSEHRVRQSMDIASEIGLRGVVFHTGRLKDFRDESYIENWLDRNEEFFREIINKYPKQNIFIENMFDESPDMLLHLAQRFKDEERFKVCLDYAHAVISGTDGRRWVEELSPYIRHMHINDNDMKNDMHLEIGTGKIDWRMFDDEMRRYGVEASVLVEMQSLECQRRSMQYMKENKIYPFSETGKSWQHGGIKHEADKA